MLDFKAKEDSARSIVSWIFEWEWSSEVSRTDVLLHSSSAFVPFPFDFSIRDPSFLNPDVILPGMHFWNTMNSCSINCCERNSCLANSWSSHQFIKRILLFVKVAGSRLHCDYQRRKESCRVLDPVVSWIGNCGDEEKKEKRTLVICSPDWVKLIRIR